MAKQYDAAGNRIYSKTHARRLRAAARKVAEAMERVAEATTESYRDDWLHPSMRKKPAVDVESPPASRVETTPGPDLRTVVSQRHSCG
jgi:hypothetical protein